MNRNDSITARQKVAALIEKYNQGTASVAERAQLEQWYHRGIKDGRLQEADGDFLLLKDVLWDSVSERAGLAAEENAPSRVHPWRGVLRIAAVAAVVLLATMGIWMGWKHRADKPVAGRSVTVNIERETEAISPGGNRATLTLADGRQLDLSESQNGIVIGPEGITYTDGSGILDAEALSKGAGLTRVDYAVLSTPRGGTYQITLPDGSKVWLNAASTLTYPVDFPEGQDRVVELEGEAYFEVMPVAKSGSPKRDRFGKLPFLVKANNQTVEVLGTQFNISAYPDETDTKTTLVEGRVGVSLNGQGPTKMLVPGEQATVRGSAIDVRQVDIEPFVAWKSGVFIFDNTSLEIVMRQVMRWYDIEIDLEQLPDRQITGIVSRQEKLSAVLEALAISSGLHFTLQERRLLLKRE